MPASATQNNSKSPAGNNAHLRSGADKFFDVPGALLVEADFDGFLQRLSASWADLLGWTTEELTSRAWLELVHSEDRAATEQCGELLKSGFEVADFRNRWLHRDGSFRWLKWNAASDCELRKIYAVAQHVTEQVRAERALATDKKLLQMIAAGAALGHVLDTLMHEIEDQSSGAMLCSVLLLDESGQKLLHGGAPSLPQAYNDAINGLTIGPSVGSCGTAAFTRKQVGVEDISADPLWSEFKGLAEAHELRACFSKPIFSSGDELFGTIAMYYRQPRKPDPHDQQLIDRAADLAAIVIERKRREDEITRATAESVQLRRVYETILSNTPDLAYVFDLQHRFTYANEGLLKMWGRSMDEAIGKTCLELGYEPWHAEMHDREIDKVVDTGQPIRGEVPFEGTFGRRIYDYIFVPVWGADGAVESVAGTTRDVTEIKQAEEALRLHSEQIESLLRSAPIGIYLIDADFKIREVNPIAAPVFGNIAGGPIGHDFREILRTMWQPNFAEEVIGIFHHTMETGKPYVAPERPEFRIDRGVTEYYDWRLSRVTLPDGQFGVVCYFQDISNHIRTRHRIEETAKDLERLNAELAASRDAAMAASQAKSMFLANMSHELRTPLNAIIGYAELLKDELTSESHPELTGDLGKIRSAGQHLLQLIDDVLDMSKIEAGKLTISREEFSADSVVHEAAETIQNLMNANGNVLEVRRPAELGQMQSDPLRLRQILFNLLSNAAKFTRNGKVTLEALTEIRDGAEWVMFRVTDTGRGMTPEQMGRLFEKFHQAENARVAGQSGTGLGLAITRELCQMMGGSISATSVVDGGSTFEVLLPKIAVG